MRLLEVCVGDAAGLQAAVEGGADRIELCSALDLGGLTPSAGLMAEAARLDVPVIALIRPASGGFVYGPADERLMRQDIETALDLGLAGVAIGALSSDGGLDLPLLQRLSRAARGGQLTLHRAFDLVPDPSLALEQAVALGFHRILTAGGAVKAADGTAQLAALVRQAGQRLKLLAGSGITPDNVRALLDATGVNEVHASCREPRATHDPRLSAFGFAPSSALVTSAARVRQLRSRLIRP